MPIELSKDFEQEIRRRVCEGSYASAEEFLRVSIRHAEEYRARVRAAVDEGTEEARRGDLTDGDALFDALDAELARGERDG